MPIQATHPCPCDAAKAYGDCCGRWHSGEPAIDAQALMRSRYSAFVLGRTDYLLATWHPQTRPQGFDLEDANFRSTVWLGLRVKHYLRKDDDHAEVEFIARYRTGGSAASRLHELSRFVREAGVWYYFDGVHDPAQ